MSIENAILELAAALRQVAEANQAIAAASLKTEESYRASIGAYAAATAAGAPPTTIEQDVTRVETDAKTAQQKAMDKVSTGKQEIAQALAKAKADKVAAQDAAKVAVEDDPLADSALVELDYEKDVKPLLVKVGKDKTQLVALLEKFGAKKGDQIAKADYPAVVAAANAIIGG